jgi:Zn-dependent protease
VLFRALALLIIAAVHGFVACLAARSLGDKGPAQDGRMTLNPLPGIDILGLIGMLVFGLGWIKPLDVTPSALRQKVFGTLAIVVAATLATLLLAVLAGLLLPPVALLMSDTGAPLAGAFIISFVRLSIGFALFNLIPIPPLTGGYFLDAVLPAVAAPLRKYAIPAGVVWLVILASGFPDQVLAPLVDIIAAPILHVVS